jgi:MoaA/NifB/PqqE/SkfB family radical SAM enzyme
MARELALATVDELAARGTLFVGLVGGEPLLYPHLFELIERLSARGIRSNVNTHGGLLTVEAARRFAAAGLSYASISIDSPDRERNEEIRRGIRHAAVLEAIEHLRAHAPRTEISIGMTLSRANLEELPAMCRFAARHGVRYLKFQPLTLQLDQRAPGPVDAREALALREQDLPALTSVLREANRQGRRLGLLTNARMLLDELRPALRRARTLPCVAGAAILFIDPEGHVGGCPQKVSAGTLGEGGLGALMRREPEVFRFASGCPLLPDCFDTTYGELSHLHHARGVHHALDLLDRVLFYA